MTSTEEIQTETNVTTTTATPPSPPPPTPASPPAVTGIKRQVQLYRYCLAHTTKIQPLRRFLGKKCWNEVTAIIYDDSTLKIFEDDKFREPVFEIKLENVALYLAFAKAANKYGPPPITEKESNFIAPNNLIAVPETKEYEKVHWFAAKDEPGLKSLIQAVAETIDGKCNPPQLGKGAKYRYAPDDNESKWKTYWLTCAQQQTNTEMALLVDENGGTESKFVATPLVAVAEQQKQKQKPSPPPVPAKNGSAKSKPTPHPRQPPNYYNIEFVVPEIVETLAHDSDDGLRDELDEGNDKIVVVRLINGKKIKETVANPKKAETETAPALPDTPPPPIPTVVIDNDLHKEMMTKIEAHGAHKTEMIALIKDEPVLLSMKIFDADDSSRPQLENGNKEENIEIVTSQHSAVVSIASVEHTVSTSTEYVANVSSSSCTTTKECTSFQQTNGITSVH